MDVIIIMLNCNNRHKYSTVTTMDDRKYHCTKHERRQYSTPSFVADFDMFVKSYELITLAHPDRRTGHICPKIYFNSARKTANLFLFQ